MDSSTGSRQPRSDCTATCLRSRSPTNWPALPGACWPTAAFLKQSFRPREHLYEVELPAEVCERIRRDGGSVFPAYANTGDPNGPSRGLSGNELARALISMMARSTRRYERGSLILTSNLA